MSQFAEKVAVITGASKGIGAGIAKELAAHGASVVVNYSSSEEDADKVVAEITKAGGKAIAVRGNIAKQEDIDNIFAETKASYGKVDILVNNAGVYAFSPIETLTMANINATFSVNVFGLMLTTKAALPFFPPEGGSIINIGAVIGERLLLRLQFTPEPHLSESRFARAFKTSTGTSSVQLAAATPCSPSPGVVERQRLTNLLYRDTGRFRGSKPLHEGLQTHCRLYAARLETDPSAERHPTSFGASF